MAKIYAELIKKRLKTIDDVPEKLKTKVKQILKEMGDDSVNKKGGENNESFLKD